MRLFRKWRNCCSFPWGSTLYKSMGVQIIILITSKYHSSGLSSCNFQGPALDAICLLCSQQPRSVSLQMNGSWMPMKSTFKCNYVNLVPKFAQYSIWLVHAGLSMTMFFLLDKIVPRYSFKCPNVSQCFFGPTSVFDKYIHTEIVKFLENIQDLYFNSFKIQFEIKVTASYKFKHCVLRWFCPVQHEGPILSKS